MDETRRIFRIAGCHRTRPRLRTGQRDAVLLAIVFAVVCALPGHSQSSGSSGGGGQQTIHSPSFAHPDPTSSDDGDLEPTTTDRRIRALNAERQKQIVADTDKLLKLARELNDEVAKANTGALTSDELHKIADIEKLARNVRQKMTEGVGDPQTIMAPPMIFPTH